MTTQKEFHNLMQEMEDCYEEGMDTMKFISISGRFIPLAIDRIKRLERAVDIAERALEYYRENRNEAYFIAISSNFKSNDCANLALEQIKKELGE